MAVLNIRSEQRESRDLIQDLQDIQSGIKITHASDTQKNQKEINNIINAATQEILLDKASTEEILNKAAQDWKKLEE